MFLCILPYTIYGIIDLRQRSGAHGVTDLQLHLGRQIQTPCDLHDAAVPVARTGEVLAAHQLHQAANVDVASLISLYPYVVCRTSVNGVVHEVRLIIAAYGCRQFLFGSGNICLRHADVPRNVRITGFRFQSGSWQLLSVGPYIDDLKLPRCTIIVCLKIVIVCLAETLKIARLERYAYLLVRQQEIIGIERQ